MEQMSKYLYFTNILKNMKLSKISFVRGFGIIEHYFVLSFVSNNEELDIEIETNFRIRNAEEVLLNFNDLYLDFERKEMSVRKYRSQLNIEKSYLYKQLEYIGKTLDGSKVRNIIVKRYGDIYIFFKRGIVIEIFNDTHLENAALYRIIYKKGTIKEVYECQIENNVLSLKSIDWI